MIAISSRIRSRELLSLPPSLLCSGELKPLPAVTFARTFPALGRRKRLDWARLRRRDLENSLTAWSAVGYALAHARSFETSPASTTYVFVSILVDGQVYCTKRSAPDLVFDEVLVDAVLCGAVIFAVAVFRLCIECLLQYRSHQYARIAEWKSEPTFTCRLVPDGALVWCRSGLR